MDRLPRLRADAPDAVSVIFGIDRAGPDAGYPDDLVGKPITYLAWNHSGSAEDVERDTAGLRVGPTPVTTTIASVPYLDVQTAHDLAFAWGSSRSFIKSHNANDVRREALDELVELVATAPGRGRSRSRPWAARSAACPRTRRPMPAERRRSTSARTRAGGTRHSTRRMPTGAGGRWPWSNPTEPSAPTRTATADVGPEESRRIYGDAKLARLAALKREWDPDNVFHVNPNVAPAAG